MMLSYKGWFVFSQLPSSVGGSLWNRSCGEWNCSGRATVPLGIDTLIANILVLFSFLVHRFFEVPEPIFAKLCHTMQYVLKYFISYKGVHKCSLTNLRGENPHFFSDFLTQNRHFERRHSILPGKSGNLKQ